MITNGESKIVTVDYNDESRLPCEIYQEMMMQLDKDAGEIEMLINLENQEVIKLKELVPSGGARIVLRRTKDECLLYCW